MGQHHMNRASTSVLGCRRVRSQQKVARCQGSYSRCRATHQPCSVVASSVLGMTDGRFFCQSQFIICSSINGLAVFESAMPLPAAVCPGAGVTVQSDGGGVHGPLTTPQRAGAPHGA